MEEQVNQIHSEFGNKLKHARVQADLTQQHIASLANISRKIVMQKDKDKW